MPYYEHPIKCLNCGLHFLILSDYEDWPDKGTTREQKLGEATGTINCPECNTTGNKLVFSPRQEEGFIFQKVGGQQEAKGVR